MPPELRRLDVKIFTGIVKAGEKGSTLITRIRTKCSFGSGRQALGVLNGCYSFEGAKIGRKAHKSILDLKLKNVDHLDTFLAKYELLREKWKEEVTP